MFKAIRTLYRCGKIDAAGVADAVVKGLITAEQYQQITGQPYAGGDPV